VEGEPSSAYRPLVTKKNFKKRKKVVYGRGGHQAIVSQYNEIQSFKITMRNEDNWSKPRLISLLKNFKLPYKQLIKNYVQLTLKCQKKAFDDRFCIFM
jgi:hypothetical protein